MCLCTWKNLRLCKIRGKMEIRFRYGNGSKAGKMCLPFALFNFIKIAGERAAGAWCETGINGGNHGQGKGQPDAPGLFANLGPAENILAKFF